MTLFFTCNAIASLNLGNKSKGVRIISLTIETEYRIYRIHIECTLSRHWMDIGKRLNRNWIDIECTLYTQVNQGEPWLTKVKYIAKRLSNIRLSNFRLSNIRLSNIRISSIRLSNIRLKNISSSRLLVLFKFNSFSSFSSN